MNDVESKISELWNRYHSGSLPNDPNLHLIINKLKKTLPKGHLSSLLQIIDIDLNKRPMCSYPIKDVSSMHLYKNSDKRILLVGVSSESSSVYPFFAEYLRTQLPIHVDMFVNYPYTQNRKVLDIIKQSYRAGQVFSLANPNPNFYQNVRFHACDIRAEWMSKLENQKTVFEPEPRLLERVYLLGIYSNYLASGNKQQFLESLRSSNISFASLLKMDDDVMKLEGKIMKSYSKNTNEKLANQMITFYRKLIKPTRVALSNIKNKWSTTNEVVLSIDDYLEFMAHWNFIYQYINVLYTLLRMFRSFTKKPDQYSEDPTNCIVLLPEPLIRMMSEFLSKYGSWNEKQEIVQSICQETLVQALHKWKQ